MSNVWGKKISLSIFGESHGECIGIVMNGIKAGFKVDMEYIKRNMLRRLAGMNNLSTQRKEEDKIEILSGIFNGMTTGAPICMIIRNNDVKSKDYDKLKYIMRPSHSDFSANVKYGGFNDYRGGGHFSGRLTAPLVFAGAIAKQILEQQNIFIGSHIKQVGNVFDSNFDFVNLSKECFDMLLKKELPMINSSKVDKVKEEILLAKQEGDSVGGIIECGIIGVNAGIGEPFFNSIESTIAQLAFSIPAVKGIEFGMGFGFSDKRGSQCKDEYYIENGRVKAYENNNGGILGGITNGMPIIFRTVIKPTPSISKEQRTVNIDAMENTVLNLCGRHDPCIVQRAVVVVECIGALSVLELL